MILKKKNYQLSDKIDSLENKKTTRLSGFLPTEVVRTGIEPVFHP